MHSHVIVLVPAVFLSMNAASYDYDDKKQVTVKSRKVTNNKSPLGQKKVLSSLNTISDQSTVRVSDNGELIYECGSDDPGHVHRDGELK